MNTAVASPVAVIENQPWVPACGGSEKPSTTRAGRLIQYVWQPETGLHRYLDLQTKAILPVSFDPALDGSPDDSSLWRPFSAFFLHRSPPILTVVLATCPPQGPIVSWQSSFDLPVRRGSVYDVTPTVLNEGRRADNHDDFSAMLGRVTESGTRVSCDVDSRDQALQIADVVSRVLRTEAPALVCNMPLYQFTAARELLKTFGGNPELLTLEMKILAFGHQQPSSYNW